MSRKERMVVLVPAAFRTRLRRRAKLEGLSVGELVRRACEERLRWPAPEERQRAAEDLVSLSLPIASPERMRRESAPDREDCQLT